MTYEKPPHPSTYLDLPKKSGAVSWWWFLLAGVAALILVGIFRPHWLVKIGVHINLSSAARVVGVVSNPMN